jgi:hypothetical protein
MGDRRKCQTYTASPAEPGGLPVMLGVSSLARSQIRIEVNLMKGKIVGR